MSQELSKREETGIMQSYSNEQVELIKDTVAKGATDNELKLFLYQANRTGLDPLAKQIYCVKRWDSKARKEIMAVQTGIDGFRVVADRTGLYAGNDDPVCAYDEKGNIESATVTVYKVVGGLRCPFTATARWSEYYPGEKQGFMWRKMPHVMLGKCAESLALRKAFPADLSGIYTHDEMAQADSDDRKPAQTTTMGTAEELPPAAAAPEVVDAEILDEAFENIYTQALSDYDKNKNHEIPHFQRVLRVGYNTALKIYERMMSENIFSVSTEPPKTTERKSSTSRKKQAAEDGPKENLVPTDRTLKHPVTVAGKEIMTAGITQDQILKISGLQKVGDNKKKIQGFLDAQKVTGLRFLTEIEGKVILGLIDGNKDAPSGEAEAPQEPQNDNQAMDAQIKRFWAIVAELKAKDDTDGIKAMLSKMFSKDNVAESSLHAFTVDELTAANDFLAGFKGNAGALAVTLASLKKE